jgi:hypothetical protein
MQFADCFFISPKLLVSTLEVDISELDTVILNSIIADKRGLEIGDHRTEKSCYGGAAVARVKRPQRSFGVGCDHLEAGSESPLPLPPSIQS